MGYRLWVVVLPIASCREPTAGLSYLFIVCIYHIGHGFANALSCCCQQIDLSAFRANELSTFRLAGKARRGVPEEAFLLYVRYDGSDFATPSSLSPFSSIDLPDHSRQVSWAHEIRIEFHRYSDAPLPLPLCNYTGIHP